MDSLLIKNGHIIDPKNKINRIGNILIENGRITGFPEMAVPAARIINAAGKVVCPGFIDIHMHEGPYDPETDTLDKSIASSMALMGVTTAIGGNCGDNQYQPDLYLDALDRLGAPINMGLFAGHTSIRKLCGGMDKYSAVNGKILEQMCALAEGYMDSGCFGISFGIKYVPGIDNRELLAMAALCKRPHKLVAAHVRYDAARVFDAVRELIDLSIRLDIPVQNSHIGSMGGFGQMAELLEMIDFYHDHGVNMMSDCYPYDAFSTSIGETTYDDGFLETYQSDYHAIEISTGKYRGKRCTKEIFDELRANDPRAITVGHFMREEDIELALLHKNVMVASDGFRNGNQGHPRAAGTFPRFLARYARTGKLNLSSAIEKMTAMPADRLGLFYKGNLSVGSDADIVIFEFNRIQDNATFDEPAKAPSGITYVIIGGEPAVENGVLVNDHLGHSIRG